MNGYAHGPAFIGRSFDEDRALRESGRGDEIAAVGVGGGFGPAPQAELAVGSDTFEARNVRDFGPVGVPTINPWDEHPA